jgi:hypothetical protein
MHVWHEHLHLGHCYVVFYYYLAGCTMFPHLPAPIKQFDNYIIFFLQLFLSFQSSYINPFSPISPLIPSAQVSLGLPRFLLPDGRHFITSFGNLPSSILWTCPYHWCRLVLISYKRDLSTFIFCLITVFLILTFLEIRAELRQKSISVEFSFATVLAFKHHVSAAYVIVLLTTAW